MEIKWYGTASISIEDQGVKLLFDPFVRMNKRLRPAITLADYKGADAIFATHGHFDHIFSVPDIEKTESTPVYATKTPVETLKKEGVAPEKLHVIAPGDKINIGHFTVTAYQAKHVTFDAKYVLSVIPQSVILCPKIFYQEYLNIKFPENNENLGYLIENGEKRVFIMGSFGTVPEETYPKNCDMFILPFGGCTKVPELTAPFISYMMPKSVLITHYDNSFPPATRRVDAEGLCARIHKDHPGIRVIIPTEKKGYDLHKITQTVKS